MKKIMCVLLAAVLLLMTAAFAEEEEAVVSYTGTVQAIEDMTITLLVDETEMEFTLTEETVFGFERGMGGERPDGMPEGEMPEGEMPEGKPEDGVQPPENGGEVAGVDSVIPDLPEDGMEGKLEQMPEMPEGGFEGGMTLTIEDIKVGDTVTVQTDAEGNVTAVLLSGKDMGDREAMTPPEATKEPEAQQNTSGIRQNTDTACLLYLQLQWLGRCSWQRINRMMMPPQESTPSTQAERLAGERSHGQSKSGRLVRQLQGRRQSNGCCG